MRVPSGARAHHGVIYSHNVVISDSRLFVPFQFFSLPRPSPLTPSPVSASAGGCPRPCAHGTSKIYDLPRAAVVRARLSLSPPRLFRDVTGYNMVFWAGHYYRLFWIPSVRRIVLFSTVTCLFVFCFIFRKLVLESKSARVRFEQLNEKQTYRLSQSNTEFIE